MADRKARTLRRMWLGGTTLALFVIVVGGPFANAGISDTVFSIQATNDSGTATYFADFNEGTWNPDTQTFTWSLPSSIDLLDEETYVATLESASITVEMLPTPQIQMSFGVVSGTSDTGFLIDSAAVDFNTIPADLAAGYFLAGCTVYDSGADDGMWLYEPGLEGFGAFQSYYNLDSVPAPLFSHLLAVVGSSGGGMANGSQSYPGSGYAPINADVDDMYIHADFILTDYDSAETNTTYILVPEPTGLVLLTLGGVLVGWRRRRA